ncbi:complex I subunit 4 family protein [Aurantibacillus circumpalustris]|uniref:complex I subunit 4 family protein n=1 Tax=Aurantibacillus circumpalustris TaxID=3036359 RepID=UPI00295C1913|nr:NADH-quinone oxidoreductase subunit M [Aurantibacillus circumpalustris]
MLTALLIGFPLFAALLVFFSKGTMARNLALTSSVIEFVISLIALYVFKNTPDSGLLVFDCVWVQSLGIHFSVGIDALSILMILLTTFLVPLIILSSYKNSYANSHNFYGLILVMQMALVGVFSANDGFLFYVFWELALIPIYFICLMWGGENRGAITFKFFVYTLFGSLFMLVGLIYLYNHTYIDGLKSWAIQDLYNAGRSLNAGQQGILFWLIFIAFAIKMPIFPFHTWQPDTYVNAPTQGTMLLSGIMLKMGTFGVIKWLLPIVPLGLEKWGGTAIGLSVIGIVYASCIAIVQKDFKRLIAYSSIAHVGLISAGILSANQQGIQGALMQMLAHGVNVVGLFFIADILLQHTGTREIEKLGGIRGMNGNFAVLFLIVVLGSVALPLTNGFVGEFLLINGVYQFSAILAAFAGLTIILGAVYMLRSYQNIMLGERRDSNITFGPLASTEKAVLIIVCIVIVAFGVYPKPLNDIAEEATRTILTVMK